MGYWAIMEHWRWEHDRQIPTSPGLVAVVGVCGQAPADRDAVLGTVAEEVSEERISCRYVSRKW